MFGQNHPMNPSANKFNFTQNQSGGMAPGITPEMLKGLPMMADGKTPDVSQPLTPARSHQADFGEDEAGDL